MALRRVGIFGGVFNPVHFGHLALAKKAISSLHLDILYVIPCSDPPHKPIPAVDARLRFKMTQIAFRDIERVCVSPMEIERVGTSYTIDTIRSVKQLEANSRPVLLIGADNISEIATWKNPKEIFAEADVAAFTRPGFDLDKRVIQGLGDVQLIPMEPQNHSSTEIRDRLKEGLSIVGMVPEAVAVFMNENRFYLR
jgi:nicotinate-nucleotide adenylyltransferase